MAYTELKEYSPKRVIVNWGGILRFDGYASDTFVNITRNADDTSESVGADGSLGVAVSADDTGTVEISLQQTSPTNISLGGIHLLQREQGTIIRAPMTISDPSGSCLCLVTGAYIKTPPVIALSNDYGSRTWTFYASNIKYTNLPDGLAESATVVSQAGTLAAALKQLSDQTYANLF